MIRTLLSDMLEGDYEVLLAADGLEAKKTYEEHAGQVAAVITELATPRMNGARLVEWLRQRNSRLPMIVLAASYVGGIKTERLLWRPAIVMLQKPFEWSHLIDLLARLLRAPRDA